MFLLAATLHLTAVHASCANCRLRSSTDKCRSSTRDVKRKFMVAEESVVGHIKDKIEIQSHTSVCAGKFEEVRCQFSNSKPHLNAIDAIWTMQAWFKHGKPHSLWGIFPRLAYEIFQEKEDGWKITMKYFQNVVSLPPLHSKLLPENQAAISCDGRVPEKA